MSAAKWKLNLFRRRKYWAHSEVIFIHVPKAAGTSINRALYGRTLGHYSAVEIQSTFPALYEKSYTFSMVRNPWDRALSAYRFARMGNTETMGIHKPQQYKIAELETFEKFVMDWLPKQDLRKADFVFQPQYWFVCDKREDIIVDFLGKTENINSDLSKISKKINKEIVVRRENSTSSHGLDYRKAYKSSKMVDAVHSIYKKDVDKFGYEFE